MKRIIAGWSVIGLIAADFIFTYVDNSYHSPPTPVTSWLIQGDLRLSLLILIWILGFLGSIILMQSVQPPKRDDFLSSEDRKKIHGEH
jgi:hypothetical protein